MFKFKKKKSEIDKPADSSIGNLASEKVKVIVQKWENNTPIELYSCIATETTKNDAWNLEIVNNQFNFREEVEHVQNQFLMDLELELKLQGMTKEDKVVFLKAEIGKQTKLISNIDKDGKIKVKTKSEDGSDLVEDKDVNRLFEKNRLKHLELLLYHFSNFDDVGAYEKINLQRMRQRTYTLKDGLLYPERYNHTNNTVHTDMNTKKKVYKIQYDLAIKRYLDKNKPKFENFMRTLTWIIAIALIGLGAFWNVQNNKAALEMDSTIDYYRQMAEGATTKCNSLYIDAFSENIDLLKYKHYIVSKKINDNIVSSDKFTDEVYKIFEALYPLNSFINEGINYHLNIDN